MRPERATGERTSFRREWNVALGLVAAAAILLLLAGYTLAATLAVGLGIGAIAARWAATKRKGRRFYE